MGVPNHKRLSRISFFELVQVVPGVIDGRPGLIDGVPIEPGVIEEKHGYLKSGEMHHLYCPDRAKMFPNRF
jgi:hypothetical protein